MYKQSTILVCLVIMWVGCYSAYAQIDSLRLAGDEREQHFKSRRLVWSVTTKYTYTPPPENPQASRQEAEFLERELRARGVRDVSSALKQLERENQLMRRRNVLVSEGNWEVEWGTDEKGKGFLFISGIRKFHKEVVQFQEFYGEGWGMQIGVPTSGRPGLPPIVWCCTGHCARYPALNDGGLDIGIDELSIIASLNALRMNGEAGWEVVGQTKDSVHLRKRNYLDTYGVFEIDIVLDLRHGGIPNRIVKSGAGYEGEIQVTRYTQSGGYWLPESVKSVFRTRERSPGMLRERTWRLRGVQPKRGVSLKALQTGRYWSIRDMRAYGCNLSLNEVLSGDKDVFYQWRGRLPTVDEVKAMLAARQQRRSRSATSAVWYRFIPPVLLITIGIFWYWRLKRAEGKR